MAISSTHNSKGEFLKNSRRPAATMSQKMTGFFPLLAKSGTIMIKDDWEGFDDGSSELDFAPSFSDPPWLLQMRLRLIRLQ